MRWRFVWLDSRGGTHARTVESAAALLAAQAWAQRCYARWEVDDWLWFTLWEPDLYRRCPRCGHGYLPGRVRVDLCRCGVPHTTYDCHYASGHTHTVPPRHDGCAALPHDAAAYRPPRQLRRRPR